MSTKVKKRWKTTADKYLGNEIRISSELKNVLNRFVEKSLCILSFSTYGVETLTFANLSVKKIRTTQYIMD